MVVEGGRITGLGPNAQVRVPPRAQVVDGTGKYLIPGLWDMHVHVAKGGRPALPAYVLNGVTSVRDMGGDFALVQAWRDEIARGTLLGPRIKTAGPILEARWNYDRMAARTRNVEPIHRTRVPVGVIEDAERVVDSLARLGVDFLKVRTVQSRNTYRAIAAAARRHGLMLTGHAPPYPVQEIVAGGQRSVEHGLARPLSALPDSERTFALRELPGAGVAMVTTLVNFPSSLLVPVGDVRAALDDSVGRAHPGMRFVGRGLRDDWLEQASERGPDTTGALPAYFAQTVQTMRELHRAGVTIMPGTDVAVLLVYPGSSLHEELALLVEQVGMTPMEAIVSATSKPAAFFGMQAQLGTIAPGRIADLVLLDRNPLENIRHTREIAGVVQGGAYLSRDALRAIDGAVTALVAHPATASRP